MLWCTASTASGATTDPALPYDTTVAALGGIVRATYCGGLLTTPVPDSSLARAGRTELWPLDGGRRRGCLTSPSCTSVHTRSLRRARRLPLIARLLRCQLTTPKTGAGSGLASRAGFASAAAESHPSDPELAEAASKTWSPHCKTFALPSLRARGRNVTRPSDSAGGRAAPGDATCDASNGCSGPGTCSCSESSERLRGRRSSLRPASDAASTRTRSRFNTASGIMLTRGRRTGAGGCRARGVDLACASVARAASSSDCDACASVVGCGAVPLESGARYPSPAPATIGGGTATSPPYAPYPVEPERARRVAAARYPPSCCCSRGVPPCVQPSSAMPANPCPPRSVPGLRLASPHCALWGLLASPWLGW